MFAAVQLQALLSVLLVQRFVWAAGTDRTVTCFVD